VRKAPSIPPVPQPGEGKRGEQGYLGYLLRQASVALRTRMERGLSEEDVTPPQFAVLTMVGAYPGLSNADLARLSLLTPQTVSVIVSNLKRSGRLASRPHAVHGRIQQLEITKAGRDLLARCRPHIRRIEKRLAAGLSANDEQVIRRWLVRVAMDEPQG
jgi:DNA-binding MarR family transcriptional regulator